MPYEYLEWDDAPEPQASSARIGGPPRKATGIGVLDPPIPPRRPPGRMAALPSSFLLRMFAALILAGLGAFIFFLLFHR